MEFNLDVPQTEEDMFAQRKKEFDEHVLKLQLEHGWTPRKAKRAMLAHSNKQIKKFKKQVSKNKDNIKPFIVPTKEELRGEDC